MVRDSIRRPLALGGLLLGAAVAAGTLRESRLDPASWRPGEIPELTGPLAENRELTDCDRVLTTDGPEDVAFDDEGRLYTGAENGTVYRTTDPVAGATNVDVEPVADTGGRPLALEFSRDDLLVCVAQVGLVSVDPDGEVTRLSTEAGGRDIVFADDLHVADDGTVYFTDASEHELFQDELFELQDTGRLLAYEPDTGETRVEVNGLGFANGVELGPDGESLLVNETSRYRITRYWHTGEREGRIERWAENLVGYPDNIDRGPDGSYWVAIPSLRDPALERLHRRPWLKRQLGKLPEWVLEQVSGDPYGLVLQMNEDGEVVDSLHDPTGGVFGVTSATPHDGALYLGTLFGDSVVRYPLD